MRRAPVSGAILGLLSAFPLCVISASGFGSEVPADAVAQCVSLKDVDLTEAVPDAPVRDLTAQVVPAAGETPGYCRVAGSIEPDIGFELRLPVADWNQKFAQYGCGGRCGVSVNNGCETAVRRGYACITTDMGHKGPGSDSSWAFDNLQAEADYGYRATHLATLVGKALSQEHYGRAAVQAYFYGCSTGGRQGLVEAQYFPWDFDGVISGAPIPDGNALLLAWNSLALLDENGNALLDADDLRFMNQAVIEACDSNDGLADALIGDPRACNFDVETLACGTETKAGRCLSPSQIEAVRRMYQGPVNDEGERLTSGRALPGSELGWFGFLAGPKHNAMSVEIPGNPPVRATNYYRLANEQFRYLRFWPDAGRDYDISQFDWNEDYKRLRLTTVAMAPANPDLRDFKSTGGKIISYQGWDDAITPPESVIDYYENVTRTMGGMEQTQDFYRLYMLPGLAHCVGGPGAMAVDYLTALEQWVEQGQAPDMLLASHVGRDAISPGNQYLFPLEPRSVSFTRPVFPYPRRVRYSGEGDSMEAASFVADDPAESEPDEGVARIYSLQFRSH